MAGKRLLDAAKLLNAAAAVGKQHAALRRQQWELYGQTSSLARAVKEQTDRVTVTAGAAWELARRLSEVDSPRRGGWREEEEEGREAREWRAESQEGDVRDAAWSDAKEGARDAANEEGDVKAALRKDEAQRVEDYLAQTQESAAAAQTTSTSPETQPKQEDIPAGVNLEGLFQSSRVSRKVGKTGPNIDNLFGARKKMQAKPLPEMLAADRRREEERSRVAGSATNVQSATKQDDRPAAPVGEVSGSQSGEADAETQRLVESIAQETEASPTSSSAANQPSPMEKPYEMHESRVPSSRFGRLWQYSGLATSMAFGAVGEGFRRFAGGSSEGSLMLSEANMNRLVSKLSRMRGAALKLGQMVSFQDSKMLPPEINAVLQRVQDSADYMPPSQRNRVLSDNLGDKWRDLFSKFEEKPFAAASIGQVHKATLASNGKDVAVKVQYPGVRNSIDSDLNNLSMLLTASRLLPKGLFLDKTIANARVELAWECDYEREAKACMHFKDLLREEKDIFAVPEVYKEASGPGVLTAEFMRGSTVTKMKDLSQHDRDWVGTQILRLCLRELMEWRFMQTDPNWTNFLYNRDTQKLELLDFGASREFPDKFVEPYVSLLIAASKGNREQCRDLSIELGYLTGDEGPEMVRAHVDSIMTLAEPFVEGAPEVYDFKDQSITERVRANIGLMLRERLAPPPEETYSLHRKLSGAFLLCARLESRVRAREMFATAVEVWNGRDVKI